MNKKEKLLNSLDGLEMSFKKKQEFVNILVGDSGSSDNSENTMEYLNISELESSTKIQLLMTAALLVKYNGNIAPLAPLILEIGDSVLPDINYIATDLNVEIATQGNILKLKDIISDSDSIPRITKEEFYKLPVALTIYGPTEDDAIDYEDKMKTSFDTLWAIWERDGVEGQDLTITIPNADIASVTLINNEGTNVFNITSILGEINTTTSKIINSIRFNGQYGATLSKRENLTTGEITYVYESMG